MKKLILTLLILSSLDVFASEIRVENCEVYGISLNSVYSMKTYANGSIKVFEVNMEEPAAAPVGVAISIIKGDGLSNFESTCRYIPGLAGVDVIGAKSKYDKLHNTIKLTMNASQTDVNGIAKSKVLTIFINKDVTSEADLVKAVLK